MCTLHKKNVDPTKLEISIKNTPGTYFPGVRWLRLGVLNAGGPGSTPGQGTRSRRLQPRPCAAKGIHKHIFKNYKQ